MPVRPPCASGHLPEAVAPVCARVPWHLPGDIGFQPWEFLELNFGIENLLDVCYAVANSYEFDVVSGSGAQPPIVYEPGRSFFGTFTLRYDDLWRNS